MLRQAELIKKYDPTVCCQKKQTLDLNNKYIKNKMMQNVLNSIY